jgi:hypothetical protein
VGRTAALFNNRPSGASEEIDRALKLLLALVKVCTAKWAGKASRSTSRRLLRAYPYLSGEDASAVIQAFQRPKEPRRNQDAAEGRRRAVVRQMRNYQVSKAAQVLVSDGLAEMDEKGLQVLQGLHPEPRDPSPPVHSRNLPAFRQHGGPSIQAVVDAAPALSCPGPSGWTFGMTRQAYAVPAFKKVLEALIGRVVTDNSVPLKSWLTASSIVPLVKKGGVGIRPIAIGEAWLRLASRWALGSVKPSEALSPESYGLARGGPEPVIHSVRDAARAARQSHFVKLDYANAFNTLSRQAIAAAIQSDDATRHLLGYFRCAYNEPSVLLVTAASGEIKTLYSRTGGRQGDPLFPFLFSLTIKPLLQELKDRFARTHDYTSGDGQLISMKLLWSYLDDISLFLRSGVTYEQLLAFLTSPEIVDKYNLFLNIVKTVCIPGEEMTDRGTDLLGSWAGGPDDASSPGSRLTLDATEKLKSRLALLKDIPAHDAFCLLRSCFAPTLTYLIRTLPPAVGTEGARLFDETVFDAIMDIADDKSLHVPTARKITQLPKRVGGLGLASQEALKPIAAASSFIQSYGILHEKGLPLSPRSREAMDPVLKQCATYLHLPASHPILIPEVWEIAQLQARASALHHETKWLELVQSRDLNNHQKCRLVENSGALARAWMYALPSPGSTMLSRTDLRYAIRRTLLSPFAELMTDAAGCRRCVGINNHPTHHLSCKATGPLRTVRHTAIRDILVSKIIETGREVRTEQVVGSYEDNHQTTHSIRNDISAVIDGNNENIDVSIIAIPPPSAALRPPSPSEVQAALTHDRAHHQQLHPVMQWDEPDEGSTHPQVAFIRKFRQLFLSQQVYPHIRTAEDKKRTKYAKAGASVFPFIITANGAVGPSARAAIDGIAISFNSSNVLEQARFRERLMNRLSVALAQFGSRMGSLCVSQSPVG